MSSEESLGLLAAHVNSDDETGFIRFEFSVNFFATCLAKSKRLIRVAPEMW